jgi:hypothetical protein
MVRDNDALVTIRMKSTQNPEHVHVAFIHKDLAVVGNLADDIAEMNVAEFTLPTITVYCLVIVEVSRWYLR